MIEQLAAGAVLAVCAVLLLRLLIGAPRRERLDAAAQRLAAGLRRGMLSAWRGPAARRRARRMADEAIRRARRREDAERDGNVVRPRSFDKPRKPH